MAELQGLTLTQIESIVARNLLGIEFVDSTMSSNGDTTSVIDTSLSGGLDSRIGSWILFDSGSNDGAEREVSDDDGAGDLTVAPALSNGTTSGDAYKLFDRQGRYRSALIRNAINDAVSYVVGRWYKPETSVALHGDDRTTRFDIPSEFDGIYQIERRDSVTDALLDSGDSVWTAEDADVTASVDTEIKKVGSSVKLVLDGNQSNTQLLATSPTFTSVDCSAKTHVEFWIRSTLALDGGNTTVRLQLDDSAGATKESILLATAVSADTWTFVRLALANPEDDTDITRIQLQNTELGTPVAHTIWLDDIRAIDDNSGQWISLNGILWMIDHENSDIVFKQPVGNYLMRIHGGSNPTTMSTGATAATAPEEYLIAKATAELMLMNSDERAGTWLIRAEQAARKLRLMPSFRRLRG